MEYIHILLSKMTAENISKAWAYAVHDNMFNFIIFLVILIWVFKKADLKTMLANLQESIAKAINDAKKAKEAAMSNLDSAQAAVKDLPNELEKIKNDAEKSADSMVQKILTEADKQVSSIKDNAEKVIEAEEKLIIANLTKNASKDSIENARKKIQWELLKNTELHNKYINQSIDELDGLNL